MIKITTNKFFHTQKKYIYFFKNQNKLFCFCSSALKKRVIYFPNNWRHQIKRQEWNIEREVSEKYGITKDIHKWCFDLWYSMNKRTEPTWRKYNTSQKRRISNSFMNETWLKITTTKSDKYYMSTQAIFRNLPQENLIKHLLKLFLEYVTNIYHSLLVHRNFKVSWKELFHSY